MGEWAGEAVKRGGGGGRTQGSGFWSWLRAVRVRAVLCGIGCGGWVGGVGVRPCEGVGRLRRRAGGSTKVAQREAIQTHTLFNKEPTHINCQ